MGLLESIASQLGLTVVQFGILALLGWFLGCLLLALAVTAKPKRPKARKNGVSTIWPRKPPEEGSK